MTLPIDRLMKPGSIAIVGASERPDAIGTRLIRNLRLMGFPGAIHPVNPRYRELAGLPCHPSLSALPEPVDAAFLAVPATSGPDLLEQAARCGIRAVFINASGYADGDAQGIALQRRIEATAREHGIALAGPNNLGLVNVHDRCAMWTPRYMQPIAPGSVAVISQSGSIALVLSEDERKLGFAWLVTTGNEAVLTVADYLARIVHDDRVSVVLLFLEAIRDPALFAAAAQEARRRGKRIIALKLGTSAGGRALVKAHTGSLAGEDRLYDAFFRAHGVVRVRDLDEMLETAVLLAADPTPPPTPHLATVSLSGGEAALLADLGAELGIDHKPLAAATLARLRPAFPPYQGIGNPLDAWGLGFNAERFRTVLDALLADPAIGTIGISLDAPGQGGADVPYACVMAEACVAAATDKRLVMFNNTSGTGVNPQVRAILEQAQIPYLSGMRPALAAIGHFSRLAAAPARVAVTPAPALPPNPALPDEETAQFRALAAAGVPMIAAECVADEAAAQTVAARLGFPVVLKGLAAHLPHKSDLGLVRLGLADQRAVAVAFQAVSAILAANVRPGETGRLVMQPMAAEGVELIVGVRNEPGFGSFVVVGPGGVLVEISGQVSVCLGPVDATTARAMLGETAAGRLLDGARGRPACNIDAAAEAIAAFSRVGAALAGTMAALEINPLIVGPDGAVGVDLLLEPRHETQEAVTCPTRT